jgi:chromosomal replication initiator protein
MELGSTAELCGHMDTFHGWISTPETRSALQAVRRVAVRPGTVNPLFLHGEAGSGKTHLVSALAVEYNTRRPKSVVVHTNARSLGEALLTAPEPSVRHCDLLIVEDAQQTSVGSVLAIAHLVDHRRARRRQTVFTSTAGPAQMPHLPRRLTSRLACGLVVGLELYGSASRRLLLEEFAKRHRLTVSHEVLDWLTLHVGGSGRQIEGAIVRLEHLLALGQKSLSVADLEIHFAVEIESRRLSLDRIVQSVGRRFEVTAKELRSETRQRRVVLPRQVAMYLCRELTPLSLSHIGTFFGGRDHSTVLHSCRKITALLPCDAALGAIVRTLRLELNGDVREAA